MAYTEQIIHIHPQAPAKPAEGAACNGCGVCCLSEPCPLGRVLSGRRTGACRALRWDGSLAQYRCGAVLAPRAALAHALPTVLRWLAWPLAPVLRRVALRGIAAGQGCDSSLEVQPDRPGAPAVSGAAASTTMPSSMEPRVHTADPTP